MRWIEVADLRRMPAVEPDVPLRVPTDVVQVQQPAVHFVFGDHGAGGGAARTRRPHAHGGILGVRAAHAGEPFRDRGDLSLRHRPRFALRIHGATRSALCAGLHPLDDQRPAALVVAVAEHQLVAVAADAACLDEGRLVIGGARQVPEPLRPAQLRHHLPRRRETASQDYRLNARDQSQHDVVERRRAVDGDAVARVGVERSGRSNAQGVGAGLDRREFIAPFGVREHRRPHVVGRDQLNLDTLERLSILEPDLATRAALHPGRHRPRDRRGVVVRVARWILILVTAVRRLQVGDEVGHIRPRQRVPEGWHPRPAGGDLRRERFVGFQPRGDVASDGPTRPDLSPFRAPLLWHIQHL